MFNDLYRTFPSVIRLDHWLWKYCSISYG